MQCFENLNTYKYKYTVFADTDQAETTQQRS